MPPRRKYIGVCIYCRATGNLTDEHAVPESLSGDIVLEKASCRACAAITGKFEGRYTGDTLRPARAVLGIRTKRKKQRPTEFPVEVTREGLTEEINVPVSDYLGVVPMLQLGLPGVFPFSHPHYAIDLKPGEVEIVPYLTRSQEEVNAFFEKYKTRAATSGFRFHPYQFGQMIAKIAYCIAVEVYGLREIEEVFVLPAILGKTLDIWQWVGCDSNPAMNRGTIRAYSQHLIELRIVKGVIFARVKFFKDSSTPVYLVVVGRISDRVRGVYLSTGYMDA
jgi:hypothetical protein